MDLGRLEPLPPGAADTFRWQQAKHKDKAFPVSPDVAEARTDMSGVSKDR